MATVQAPPPGRGQGQQTSQQRAKAELSQPIAEQPRKHRRGFWTIVILSMILGAVYGAVRNVEPLRVRAEKLPVVGSRLFAKPVRTPAPAADESEALPAPVTLPTEQEAAFQAREAETAQREEAVAAKESDLASREAQIAQVEAELASREEELNRKLLEFDKKIEETEKLRLEYEGQIRDDKARAGIISQMRTAQAISMLETMDDDSVLRIMKHLDAELQAKLFAAMDTYRASRLFQKMGGEAKETY
jgi:flagellar motility protein MotE (MotC chaperone)